MAVASKRIPAPDLVPLRRALLSVSDKTGLVDFAAGLVKAGVELVSTGGTAKAIADAGIAGARRLRPHRLPRNHGRPRQDAASLGSRRASRHPRRSRAHGRDARPRHRADRSRCRQSLSLRAGPLLGRRLCLDGREHRHRRPGHGAGLRQEPRLCRHRHRSGRLCLGAQCAGDEHRQPVASNSARSLPPRPLPAPPPTTLPSPAGLPRRSTSSIRPGAPSAASSKASCAMARTRTSRPVSTSPATSARASPRRASFRASSSPTTTSTTPTRPMNWSANSIRRALPPSPSSSTPIPCGVAEGAHAARGLRQGARLRSGLGLRRHRRAEPAARRRGGGGNRQDLHRGHHRARRQRRGAGHRRRQEEPAAARRRRHARPALGRHDA